MTSPHTAAGPGAERWRLKRRLSAWLHAIPVGIVALVVGAWPELTAHASAQELAPRSAQSDSTTNEGWYVGIASGWYFPIQAWQSAYRLGGGGTFILGDQINRHWAIQFDGNMWLLSGSGKDTWDLKAGPSVIWTSSGRAIAPFVSAGFGFDFQTDYPGKVSTIAPMIPVGLGLRFAMGTKSAFFIEARNYFVFRSVTTRDIPLLAGFRIGL